MTIMDVDGDTPNTLKRCSSAPLINEVTSTMSSSPSTSTAPRDTSPFNIFSNNNQQRTRRFSASFSASPHTHSPNGVGPRMTPRVSQLRQEECADVTNVREMAHERETHSAMQMSQSWEDLTLMVAGGGASSSNSNSISAPMSPTRVARFSPGVSPSPTRRAFATRRSLSPIAMRPSCLSPVSRPSGLVSMKRRFELDESPAAKRCCWNTERLTPSTPGTPDSCSDSSTGFTFRPVSPRAPSLPTPLPAPQNHTSPSPS